MCKDYHYLIFVRRLRIVIHIIIFILLLLLLLLLLFKKLYRYLVPFITPPLCLIHRDTKKITGAVSKQSFVGPQRRVGRSVQFSGGSNQRAINSLSQSQSGYFVPVWSPLPPPPEIPFPFLTPPPLFFLFHTFPVILVRSFFFIFFHLLSLHSALAGEHNVY